MFAYNMFSDILMMRSVAIIWYIYINKASFFESKTQPGY